MVWNRKKGAGGKDEETRRQGDKIRVAKILSFPLSPHLFPRLLYCLLCCAFPPQAYHPSASLSPVFRQMTIPLTVPA
jgi:hypothetical protein